uniref:Uncharacterized protein n=1 Tax=Anguilla anguilla TaxID=7936 RepID=A0A0E9XEM2_ANGAN
MMVQNIKKNKYKTNLTNWSNRFPHNTTDKVLKHFVLNRSALQKKPLHLQLHVVQVYPLN